ncbi:MAG: glycosyltransferase, partial [Candidatus Omnitrophica bacterium]|nr:glycosyltransferase [Candidatus Omnitrophota bacterium]
MMQNPLSQQTVRVSVIMNCYNSDAYLKTAIQSVYDQTFKDWEIVFWDNCSTDNSPRIAKGFDDKLKYFRGPRTVPLGEARNLAIEQARGDLIAFLDCDDIWLPDKLSRQVRQFEEHPQLGLVYCNAIYFKSEGKGFQLYKNHRPPEGMIFKELMTNNYIPLPTVMIPKAVLMKLGEWFDARFNMIEDADLFFRIAHDYEVGYIHEPLARYRVHDQSWTFQKRSLFPKEMRQLVTKFKEIYP